MKGYLVISYIFLLAPQFLFGQDHKLLPLKHGLDLIHGNVSKETIIKDVRFSTGENKKVDVLRFDNAGEVHGDARPLIISSQEPIRVDSLGLLSFKLHEDSLKNLLKIIENYDKETNRKHHHEDTLFRVTYRLKGNVSQFFIPRARNATSFFKCIEQRLIKMGNIEHLNKLYTFLGFSGLIRKPRDGGSKWRF